MQQDRTASSNGHPVASSEGPGARTTLESLQAECRHQAVVIERLSQAVSGVHRGAKALKAENSELRAELMPDWFRIGVQDSGSDAVISAQPADLETGGGFGLNLVAMLSERWGVERLAGGGTQVWAQLPRARADGADDMSTNGSGQVANRAA